MAEVVVYRGPNGEVVPYHSVADSAAINTLANTPGAEVMARYPMPDQPGMPPGGPAGESVTERQGRMKEAAPGVGRARRNVGAAVLPPLAAAGMTMLVPGAAPLAWLSRVGLAGFGGAAADPFAQTLRGEKPTVGHAARTGAEMAGGQLFGEGLSLIPKFAASGLASRTMAGAPRKMFMQETANEGRIAGSDYLSPSEAGLGQKMLQEGVAPGKAPWEKAAGSTELNKRIEAASQQRDALLSSPQVAGKRFTTRGLVGPNFTALRAEIAKLGDPRKMAWLEQRIRDFHAGHSLPNGKAKVYTPLEVQKDLIKSWDEVALPLHEARDDVRAAISPEAMLEGRFLKAMADDARTRLRALFPAGPNGTPNALVRANQDIYRLMPLRDAMVHTEVPKMHTDPSLTAAGSGLGMLTAIPGGPAAMAEGAGAGALVAHLLGQPSVSGRVANVLNKPWMGEAARRLPIATDAFIRAQLERNRGQQ